MLRDVEASIIGEAALQQVVLAQSIFRWKRQFGQMNVTDLWVVGQAFFCLSIY